MYKLHKRIVAFAVYLAVFFCIGGVNAFAYNSDFLDDASWVDSSSAVTKTVSYDGDKGVMDCAVSYLVDEGNSAVYFQVLANNFNITNSSDVRLYFEVLADNQRYNFYINKSGLQSSDDYSKLFAASGKFTSSKNSGSGAYLAALDVKTKASVNKIHISMSIDSQKYDLLDGIMLNAVTTTKKPTTTKQKTTTAARTTTQKSTENAANVTVELAETTAKKGKKSSSKSEASTKFVGKNKYHTTTASENETKFSATGTTAQTTAEQQQETTEVEWHTYSKSGKRSTTNSIFAAVGIALGIIALLLIGISIGKASNKKEAQKQQAEKAEKKENSDDEKIEDDFEF